MDIPDPSGPLSPSPRHMRKRRFRRDVSAWTLPPSPAKEPASAPPVGRKASHRSKRLVVLSIVVLISVSIPVLALTLILAG